MPYISEAQAGIFDAIPLLPAIDAGSVVIGAGPTLTEGDTFTLGLGTANVNTDKISIRVYRDTTPPTLTGASQIYTLPLPNEMAAPPPTYTTIAGDVGHRLFQGNTPFTAQGQTGVEVFSGLTATVLAAAAPTGPGVLPAASFGFEGMAAGDGGIVYDANIGTNVQRAKTTVKAGITIPVGYELFLLRSLTDTPIVQDARSLNQLGLTYTGASDAVWNSGGGAPNGYPQYLFAFWRNIAANTFTDALETPLSFVAVVPGTVDPGPITPVFGPANQTLGAATQDALKAALNARIANGSTALWTIDCPNGNYGNLDLQNYKLPGKTVIRSQNQNLGAKFGWINLVNCRNIYLQLVDSDQSLRGGYNDHNVGFCSSSYCGIAYSRCFAGGIYLAPNPPIAPAWIYNIRYNIRVDNNTPAGTPSDHIDIHMNLITGVCEKSIYHNGSMDGTVTDNVFENTGADCMFICWGQRNKYYRNWGSRANYPKGGSATDPWDHSDFIQAHSPDVDMSSYEVIGNVVMCANNGLPSLPRQGIFGSKSRASNWIYRDNIICNNSIHGISITGPVVTNMTAQNNTCLRSLDMPGNQHYSQFIGMNNASFNVQCALAGNTSMGSNGLNIPMPGTDDHSAALLYYTNTRMSANFYDLRPVEGKVTHWNYSAGTAIGAHKRFRDILVLGLVPNIGPAAAAWKNWYDPLNKITVAAA